MIDLVMSHTLGPASLVRRKPIQPHQSEGRLVCLGGCQAGRHAAEQLAVDLRRLGLGNGIPTRLQYYLHNFLTSQPDLNLHNPEVQDALLDVDRFWLERGVDGFRLDTINFYFHDKQLRDNPALAPERRNAIDGAGGQSRTISRNISTTRTSRRTWSS